MRNDVGVSRFTKRSFVPYFSKPMSLMLRSGLD